MKSLYEYILEAREYFKPNIPTDQAKLMFQGLADNDEIDVSFIRQYAPQGMDHSTIEAILTAYFYSKNGMDHQINDKTISKFLNMLSKQPISRIERILGAGGEGMVYDIGDNKVLKIIFDTDFLGDNFRNLENLKTMIGRKFETLPNIYKVTDKYIIRENVKPATPKCVKYFEIATTKYPGLENVGGTMENGFARGNIYDVNAAVPKTKEVQEVRKWLLTLRNELKSIGKEIKVNYGDFKPANLGETKDGRVVFFDW